MKKTNKANLRRLRIGSYGIILTAIVIALVVFVNLVVSSLPVDMIHINTKDVDYSEIGEVSEKILGELEGDVTLYLIAEKGSEDVRLEELLAMYAAKSPRIKVENIDPVEEPAFAATYTEEKVTANSVIAVSEKRARVVQNSDIYSEYYFTADGQMLSYEQYMMYAQYGYEVYYDARFEGEMAVTSALEYVNAKTLPTVYFLLGHGESVLDTTYSAAMKIDNITASELTLDTEKGVPSDCELLCVVLPTRDITQAELDTLKAYTAEGGDILYITNYKFTAKALPNFAALARNAGLEAVEGVVTEPNGPLFAAELVKSENGITSASGMESLQVIVNGAHGIKGISASGASVTTLLRSSSKATMMNVNAEGKLEENKDYKAEGAIAVAVSSERATEGGKRDGAASFVWYSSDTVIDSTIMQYYQSYANLQMFITTVDHYCEKSTSVSIIGKTLTIDPVVFSEGAANFWMTVMAVILPVAVLGAGFAVWFRRRRR